MKKFGVVLVLTFFVIGCATTDQQAKTEGAGGGAAIGALLGGVTGYLVGGDAKSALIGAGAGAAIGGVAGYAYGSNIAKHRAELKGKENDLDARITYARNINQDTQQYNEQLAQQIKDSEAQIEDLIAKAETNEAAKQELMQKKEALSKEVADANNSYVLGQKELVELQQFKSKQKQEETKDLDAEIIRLQANLAKLKENTKSLASLNQRIESASS